MSAAVVDAVGAVDALIAAHACAMGTTAMKFAIAVLHDDVVLVLVVVIATAARVMLSAVFITLDTA